ncbi:50S ribosomal protein L32 [Candidatus Parcubacteria bacterium]|nr:50S ribosomal protein L32 [Candidatus Parcubacteria bacterium]
MVVRMRHTRSHTANRRSHHSLKNPALSKESTGAVHLRHRANPKTGTYRGRKVV